MKAARSAAEVKAARSARAQPSAAERAGATLRCRAGATLRLAARAFMREPDVLVLDEPTAALSLGLPPSGRLATQVASAASRLRLPASSPAGGG